MGLDMLRAMGALVLVGLLSTTGCDALKGGGDAKETSDDDSDKKKKKKKTSDDDDGDSNEKAEADPAEEPAAEPEAVADNSDGATDDGTQPVVPTNTYPKPVTTTTKGDNPAAFGKVDLGGSDKTGTTGTTGTTEKGLTDKPEPTNTTPPDNTGTGNKTPGRGIPAPPGGRPRPGTK
jgi:hypothetical protein